MSTFMFKNNFSDFTPVSNAFIDHYMINARGEYVKVYLLMLKYCTFNEPGVNSTVLSSNLNLLESDVMNALNYWKDQGVIKLLPIDSMNNFSVEFLPLGTDEYSNSSDINLLKALDNSETSEMLKYIEKILARPLSTKEMETYLSWQKEFSFSSELILLLVEYCASKGKSDYRYIEKVAIAWYDKKITTVAEAQEYIKQNEEKWKKIRKILSYLGIKNSEIMKPQQDMIEKWLFTYKFDLPLIQKASEICFERLNRADFKYIDGILSKWFRENIKTLKDVAIKDKNFKNSYNNKNKPNGFNNFKPRDYDYDSLEKKLLGWDTDD